MVALWSVSSAEENPLMRMALFIRVAKIAAFLMVCAIFNVGFLSGQQVPNNFIRRCSGG